MIEAYVVKAVMAPFLQVLTHLHERGVLHRDIKPENILLTDQGEIKVADFGLAIDTTREKPMSRVGTLDYMPPEVSFVVALKMPMHEYYSSKKQSDICMIDMHVDCQAAPTRCRPAGKHSRKSKEPCGALRTLTIAITICYPATNY
jgi:serine/threonine protein kinase